MTTDERKHNEPPSDSCGVAGCGGSAEAEPPQSAWISLCDKVLTAYKAGEDIVVLQHFEELKTLPDLEAFINSAEQSPKSDSEPAPANGIREGISSDTRGPALERLEYCWGRALLAARRLAGDDNEHITSIVESFEQLFNCFSEYLRALAISADSALEVLQVYKMMEGPFSSRAVTAALHRFPVSDSNEVRVLLQFLCSNSVPLTHSAKEQLEKPFVMRMKSEDAEEVFKEMRDAGVEPVTTHPYSFIFMKNPPFKYMGLLDYYEDMLDRGILPVNSTFRILSRQTQNEGFANQHFSALARKNAGQPRRGDDEERGGTQIFFAYRLEELARNQPEATLDDALQVFRRMDVEGTSLVNGSAVLNVLLTSFCRTGHIEDTERVLRLAEERGCRPNGNTLHKVLKSGNPDRLHQAELILPKALEFGDVRHGEVLEILRCYVANGTRAKAMRIFRAFIIRWYQNPSEPVPFAVASLAMKLGPFDWALGVLAILLASVNEPLGMGVQSRMHDAVRDNRGRDIVRVLESHKWDRNSVLLAPQLQEPADSNNQSGGRNGEWSPTNAHQRRENGLTWVSAMHVALMEMGVGKDVLHECKARLKAAIDAARKGSVTVKAGEIGKVKNC
uniref:Uncharacterized protein TCIL3000_10_660 n=1 Tax=Trypanosoma congolense (strain IL3000) TaxID=1068625 RepID=G0UV92_TRYCI|nr:unnamed protein product [Trypanosoma congolense IL3000]